MIARIPHDLVIEIAREVQARTMNWNGGELLFTASEIEAGYR
jgi:hypothetical protein